MLAASVLDPAAAAPLRWVTSWAPSPSAAAVQDPYSLLAFPTSRVEDQSIRMVVRVTATGDQLRLRVSNRFGVAPVALGPIVVARSAGGSAVQPGSGAVLRFGGMETVKMRAGASTVSDPVAFRAATGDALAISVHVISSGFPYTWHRDADTVTYVSPGGSGDHTTDPTGAAYTYAAASWFWIDGVDQRAGAVGSVVVLGDSITDGTETVESITWPALLSQRLAGRDAVVNAGVSGNRLEGPYTNWAAGVPAIERVAPDALDLAGVKTLIVFEGINDLAGGATASSVISALATIASLAQKEHVRVLAATITPYSEPGWTPAMEAAREQVNSWIRNARAIDGRIDFDAVLRDPTDPHRLNPLYYGDGVHPDTLGLKALADAVPLGEL